MIMIIARRRLWADSVNREHLIQVCVFFLPPKQNRLAPGLECAIPAGSPAAAGVIRSGTRGDCLLGKFPNFLRFMVNLHLVFH